MGSTWAYPALFTRVCVHLHTFSVSGTQSRPRNPCTLCAELCSCAKQGHKSAPSQLRSRHNCGASSSQSSSGTVLAACLGQLFTAPSWPPFHPGNLAPFPEVLLGGGGIGNQFPPRSWGGGGQEQFLPTPKAGGRGSTRGGS